MRQAEEQMIEFIWVRCWRSQATIGIVLNQQSETLQLHQAGQTDWVICSSHVRLL